MKSFSSTSIWDVFDIVISIYNVLMFSLSLRQKKTCCTLIGNIIWSDRNLQWGMHTVNHVQIWLTRFGFNKLLIRNVHMQVYLPMSCSEFLKCHHVFLLATVASERSCKECMALNCIWKRTISLDSLSKIAEKMACRLRASHFWPRGFSLKNLPNIYHMQ